MTFWNSSNTRIDRTDTNAYPRFSKSVFFFFFKDNAHTRSNAFQCVLVRCSRFNVFVSVKYYITEYTTSVERVNQTECNTTGILHRGTPSRRARDASEPSNSTFRLFRPTNTQSQNSYRCITGRFLNRNQHVQLCGCVGLQT